MHEARTLADYVLQDKDFAKGIFELEKAIGFPPELFPIIYLVRGIILRI